MVATRGVEKFRAHGIAGDARLCAKPPRGFFKAGSDALCRAREDAIRESRLEIRLEKHGRNASGGCEKHHRAGRVYADGERRRESVASKKRGGIPKARAEHGRVAHEFNSAHAFEAGDANSFERQTRSRYQLRF